MTEIQRRLFALQDEGYRDFHAALIPTVDKGLVIGVRSPALRALAKALCSLESVGEVRYLVDGEFADSYGSVNVARPYMR